jgi:hypothetical protein
MLRLGSLVVTGVLLGVPRALESRTFGVQRSVYTEVSAPSPGLQAFAHELERALLESSYARVADPRQATLVVEVRSAAPIPRTGGPPCEGILLTVRDGAGTRPFFLHHPAQRGAAAARALLDRLSPVHALES